MTFSYTFLYTGPRVPRDPFQAVSSCETAWKNCDRKSTFIRFFKCIKIVSSLHWRTISKLVSLLHIQSIHGKMWIQDVWTSGIDWNLPGKLTLHTLTYVRRTYLIKSAHLNKKVAQSSFLSKLVLSFSLTLFWFQQKWLLKEMRIAQLSYQNEWTLTLEPESLQAVCVPSMYV